MIIHGSEKRTIHLTESQAKMIWDAVMWGWDCGRDDLGKDDYEEYKTVNGQIKCWLRIKN